MWKIELMENGNGKLQCVCCNQKRKTEVCFPWSANDKTVINNCCFSKRDHLGMQVTKHQEILKDKYSNLQ
jgi:hypothetical protein